MPGTAALTAQLVEALAHMARAQQAIDAVLASLGTSTPQPDARTRAVNRTTSVQILSVLAAHAEPLTLVDIADGVVAQRRGENEPRKGGGTRYQELCRTSLARLIERGLVARVPPADKQGLMRFRRTGARI